MNSGLLPNGKANVEIPMVAKAVEEARVSTFTNNLKDGSYRRFRITDQSVRSDISPDR